MHQRTSYSCKCAHTQIHRTLQQRFIFYKYKPPEKRISKQLACHKLIKIIRTASRMPPNRASEAWRSVQLCSLPGGGYTLYSSNGTGSTQLMSQFSYMYCNLTQRLFQPCLVQSRFVIFFTCCPNTKYKWVQFSPRVGKKKEEKYFTAMQPPSIPRGRDGTSRTQEAMEEESHDQEKERWFRFKLNISCHRRLQFSIVLYILIVVKAQCLYVSSVPLENHWSHSLLHEGEKSWQHKGQPTNEIRYELGMHFRHMYYGLYFSGEKHIFHQANENQNGLIHLPCCLLF